VAVWLRDDGRVRAPLSAEPRGAVASVRPLLAAVRAPPDGAFALPPADGRAAPEVGRSELLVVRTVVPAAPAVAGTGGSQFLNMKYCWPSVHRFVVTQYSTSPYCQ
jgi:hypothetical protein